MATIWSQFEKGWSSSSSYRKETYLIWTDLLIAFLKFTDLLDVIPRTPLQGKISRRKRGSGSFVSVLNIGIGFRHPWFRLPL